MRPPWRRMTQAVPFFAVFVAAVAEAVELARPVASASIAFDSQVAVLDFQRLIEGRHVEAFLSTTPKPLLTLVFGALYGIGHDWRLLAWSTIFAYAFMVVLTAILGRRLGGPAAGTFAAVAVLSAPALLFDVGYSLATPWAALGWLIAGLALTGTKPRYAIAGLALAIAALARVETLVVIGTAVIAVAWGTFAPPRWGGGRLPFRAWLVPLFGLLALPVMLLHDWLLFGDPMFWSTVAVRYSAATHLHVMTAFEVLRFLMDRYWALGALSLLALAGLIRSTRRGQRSIALGLLALGPGIAAVLVLLALRHVFVSDRYAAGIDLAVAFAAGLGFSGLTVDLAGWVPPLRPAGWWPAWLPRSAAAVAGTAIVAIILAGPYWRVDPRLRQQVATSRRLAADADRARLVIAKALGARGDGSAGSLGPATGVLVDVPLPIRPRMTVDLGLSLTQVAWLNPTNIDLAAGYPGAGQIVLHDRAGDAASTGFRSLEVSAPATIGDRQVVPILADPMRGLWILQIR